MAFDAQGYRRAARQAGIPNDVIESTIEEKGGVSGWLTGGKTGLSGVGSAVGNVLNLPSYAIGGVLNRGQKAFNSQYGQGEPGGGLGVLEGIKNKRAVMSELPETFGVDPTSGAGMALGFAGELLTPDLTGNLGDLYRGARGISKADELGVAAKGVNRLGGALEETGKMTPFRGLGRNNTSRRMLSQIGKSGMDSDEFVDTFNLWGRSPQDANQAISGVNKARKAAVSGAGDVQTSRIISALDDEIQRLAPAARESSSARAQLNRVMEARDNFLNSITQNNATPLNVPLSRVEESKQFVTQDIPESYFNLGASQTGKGKGAELVRRRLKNIVDDTTGETGKLGAQESALINYRDLVRSKQMADMGNMNLPFTKLVGAGAGGAIGGFPGAVAGYAGQQFLNSPTGIKAQTKALSGAGKALQNRKLLGAVDKASNYGGRAATTGFRVSQQPNRSSQRRKQTRSKRQPTRRDQEERQQEMTFGANNTPQNTQIKVFSNRDKKKRKIF